MNNKSKFILISILLSLFSSLAVHAELKKDDFKSQALSLFSVTVLQSLSVNEKTGVAMLRFKDTPAYLGVADKANRIFAIDSLKLFINLPDMTELSLIVPLEGKIHTLKITPAELESYYKVSIALLTDKIGLWKDAILDKYDNPIEREKFAKQYVIIE